MGCHTSIYINHTKLPDNFKQLCEDRAKKVNDEFDRTLEYINNTHRDIIRLRVGIFLEIYERRKKEKVTLSKIKEEFNKEYPDDITEFTAHIAYLVHYDISRLMSDKYYDNDVTNHFESLKYYHETYEDVLHETLDDILKDDTCKIIYEVDGSTKEFFYSTETMDFYDFIRVHSSPYPDEILKNREEAEKFFFNNDGTVKIYLDEYIKGECIIRDMKNEPDYIKNHITKELDKIYEKYPDAIIAFN